MKKQNASLIAKMLNKNSQPEQKPAAEEILMLDARELVPNPKNKEYSLEDIEQLASMIQMTHNIEPATARKLEDGRFMLHHADWCAAQHVLPQQFAAPDVCGRGKAPAAAQAGLSLLQWLWADGMHDFFYGVRNESGL